jgi:3-oxoacyl-[acyl-carrier-protein] synthase II
VKAEVVVTGLGAVSPFGRDVKSLWDGVLNTRQCLGPITLFSVDGLRSNCAGQVKGFAASEQSGGESRAFRFLQESIAEALQDAALHAGNSEVSDPDLAGMVVATNFGGISAAQEFLTGKASDLSAYDFAANTARAAAAIGFCGPLVTLSVSCASGTAAIVTGLELIRAGRAEVIVACGYDELSLFSLAGLNALRAVTKDEIRPFHKERSGTVFSEGAGALVLESRARAEKRGAQIYCQVAGGAMNNDAYHMTAPEKQGRGIARLMHCALKDAGVSPAQIDHINLHGTGTKYNDLIETRAIKTVFGQLAESLPVTANKGALGHAMGAAGSLESICAIRTMTEGVIPPVAGLDQQDPECDLCCCRERPLPGKYSCVMKNSYGIGGTNASVVFCRS